MADTSISGVVIGGAISAISTIGVNFVMHCMKQRGESVALAKSFKGAIRSIVSIVEKRRYQEVLQNFAQFHIGDGEEVHIMKIKASRNYLEIYSKNVDKLGLLRGRLPELIPEFYTLTNSLLEDVDMLASGEWDKQNRAFFRRIYPDMLEMLESILSVAAEIIAEIDAEYSVTRMEDAALFVRLVFGVRQKVGGDGPPQNAG